MLVRSLTPTAAAVVSFCGTCLSMTAFGAPPASPDGLWTPIDALPAAVATATPNARPVRGTFARLDLDAIRAALAKAPSEDAVIARESPVVLSLLMPDGTYESFAIVESPVMEPALAAKFPEIRTYVGQGLDRPESTVRLDTTVHGFHAQVLSTDGTVFIDPASKGETTHYASYWKRDFAKTAPAFECLTDEKSAVPAGNLAADGSVLNRAGSIRRTYRLTMSTTGEFTLANGGTVATGLAAVVTLVNRITGIYERDLSVRLSLVANNNLLIFTNPATDPFAAPTNGTQCHTENQARCDAVIGSANYDVGHVIHHSASPGGDGVAGSIGNVCIAGQKARGYSAFNPSVGDPFAIDYIAHELGHQFGGRHTFNSCGGSQGDSSTIATEPGSGVTIMAYAGICGPTDDLQPNSDAMFHAGSFDLITAYVSGGVGACGQIVNPTGNTAPTVDGGPNRTIPKNQSFTLTAVGSDPNGDALTYDWEQMDGGTADGLPVDTTKTTGPQFRTFLPVTSPGRTFPQNANTNGPLPKGEALPNVARTMNFRVVARDNRAGNGGVNTDDVVVTVANANPLVVTFPNLSSAVLSGPETITWDVGGSAAAPVSAAQVNILLSTDGGLTYPTTLASATPNDGSATVAMPNINTSTARIRIEAVGNVFFDVSNAAFTINFVPPGVALQGTGVNTAADTAGNGNANGRIDPGESAIAVNVEVENTGATTATGVSGTLTSLTPTASVGSGTRAYANIAFGASALPASPFTVAVDESHPCGNPVNLRLTLSSGGGGATYDFALPTGTPGGSGTPQTFTFSGPPVPINDFPAAAAEAPVIVSGLIGVVTDVDVRINGTSCSSVDNSTTVGVTHTFVGDLVISLRAPSGQIVTLMNRAGSTGTNLCNTRFDDDAGAPSIQTVSGANHPFSGTFAPASSLSAFDGLSPNGSWTFIVSDQAGGDIGFIRNVSVIISGQAVPACEPALPSGCGDTDFDGDGDEATDADIEAFFSVLGGTGCPTGTCGSTDFDGDGDEGTDADIEAFFAAIGGTC